MQKRVLICGAGSIGIYLGLMLHTHNNYVELFGKRKLKEIKDHIKINNKQFKIPKKIFNLTKNNYYDFIFITVKLYNLEDILIFFFQIIQHNCYVYATSNLNI